MNRASLVLVRRDLLITAHGALLLFDVNVVPLILHFAALWVGLVLLLLLVLVMTRGRRVQNVVGGLLEGSKRGYQVKSVKTMAEETLSVSHLMEGVGVLLLRFAEMVLLCVQVGGFRCFKVRHVQ